MSAPSQKANIQGVNVGVGGLRGAGRGSGASFKTNNLNALTTKPISARAPGD